MSFSIPTETPSHRTESASCACPVTSSSGPGSETLGRPITVGEFLRSGGLLAELTGEEQPLDMDELLSMVPEERRLLLAT